MNSLLKWLVGGMGALLMAIGGWWVNEVNADRKEHAKILNQLYWKDYYLNGNIPAAPVEPPTPAKK